MRSNALLIDLYELSMLRGYYEAGMNDVAVFEFFVRNMPENRNFLLAAGLDQSLCYLENFQFSEEELEWLSNTSPQSRSFINFLRSLRFSGDVDAMAEGTVFFQNEPILRVVAPMPQAQIVETRLINLLHFQTVIASKAVRSVLAAPGKLVVDFGLRRAHGSEAGLLAARASYLAGFAGTSTVEAGKLFGIPLYGTMAHSFIEAHPSERAAFKTFALTNPHNVVLLLDTYDTEGAAHTVVSLALELEQAGIAIHGVRLDSGDLKAHAEKVRRILDQGGLTQTRIFASGSLDEYEVQRLSASAPIDGFGVGTKMTTSSDSPHLDCAYKIQEYAGQPRRKTSESKETWPGRKQVFRHLDGQGRFAFDLLTLEGDSQEGKPLLKPVMRGGRRIVPCPTLADARELAASEITRLPTDLLSLEPAQKQQVRISQALRHMAQTLDAKGGNACQ